MNKSTMNALVRLLAVIAVATLPLNVLAATRPVSTARAAPPLLVSYTWYDGDRAQKIWLNPQLVAEFHPGPKSTAVAKSADANAKAMYTKRSRGAIRVWRMNNSGGAAVRALTANNPSGKYSPVFHDSPNSSGAMRALPGNIIVYLNPAWDGATVSNWLSAHKLEVVKKLGIGPNIYVIKTAPGLDALNTANALYQSGEVKAAFPDWWREVSAR